MFYNIKLCINSLILYIYIYIYIIHKIYPIIYLGHNIIPPSTITKYLDIHIYNKLTFDKYISALKASIFPPFIQCNHNMSLHHNIHYTNYYTELNSFSTILLYTYTTFVDRLTNRYLRIIYRLKKLTTLQVYLTYEQNLTGNPKKWLNSN